MSVRPIASILLKELPELKWEISPLVDKELQAQRTRLAIVTPALKQIPSMQVGNADSWPGLPIHKTETRQPIATLATLSLPVLRLPTLGEPRR
jgi:hypothetical protein